MTKMSVEMAMKFATEPSESRCSLDAMVMLTLAAEVRELQAENARLLTTAKELFRLTDRGTHGYATYNLDGSIAKVRDGFEIVTDARKVIEAAEKGVGR